MYFMNCFKKKIQNATDFEEKQANKRNNPNQPINHPNHKEP